jgi:NhaP-type Na+/H+ or K+/H+ antiporter
MEKLTPHNITVMLLSLGILLGVARTLGELAQRFHQPAVVGELLAGVLLGPTVLGTIYPDLSLFLFPKMVQMQSHLMPYQTFYCAIFDGCWYRG